MVRRAGRFSSADVHRALFPKGTPKDKSVLDVKTGIRAAIRQRHARD